jgi:hypothetical protein
VAQSWLDEASARVTAAGRACSDEEPHVSASRLLLLYRMRHRSAKAIRIGFYASMGVMGIVTTGVLGDAQDGNPIVWDVLYLILAGVLALLLRFWAVSADSAGRH